MDYLIKNITSLGGHEGKIWIDSLPELVDFFAKEWQLAGLTPYKNLSYNYVLQGHQKVDSAAIVLKLGFFKQEIQQEASALKMYNGNGCVKLLASDASKGALLLEQVNPGVSLKSLFPEQDDLAVAHAISVMTHLHAQQIADTKMFPTIHDWLSGLSQTNLKIIPEKHILAAKVLAEKLFCTQATPVLLHGDLHHDNILSSDRDSWLAIDPKGVVGEPAYEIGAFIRNPMPELLQHPNAAEIIARRINLFSEQLSIDKQRIKDWAYVQSVLAACWAVQDAEAWQQWIMCAELLDGI